MKERIEAPRSWNGTGALRVLGMGHALPGPPVETEVLIAEIRARFDGSIGDKAREIADKLGVRTRHLCRAMANRLEGPRPGERNADLAAAATRAALANAGRRVGDVDYLIGHTATPGRHLPPNIGAVATLLNYDGPFAEFRQACTGFANAVAFAHGLLRGGARCVAIVGSETGSVFFDPARARDDLGQLVNMLMMGDAAAAIVLGDDADEGARLTHAFYGQTGRGNEPGLSLPAGGSDQPFLEHGYLEFLHAFGAVRRNGPALIEAGALTAVRLGVPRIDRYLPHQAHGKVDELVAPVLGIDRRHIVVNADRVGNTGSAAIWLALSELAPALSRGETVLALGAEATDSMFGGFLYTHG